MKKLVVGSALVFLSGVSSLAMAKGPTWDYLSASWVVDGTADLNGSKEDLKGFKFGASKSLGNMLFFSVGADQYHADTSTNFDMSISDFALGGRFPLGGNTDVWGAVAYDRLTIEGAAGLGLGVDFGLRSQINNNIDLGATYHFSNKIDFGSGIDSGDYKGYELSGAYAVAPNTSVLLTLSDTKLEVQGLDIKHHNVVGLGVRFGF